MRILLLAPNRVGSVNLESVLATSLDAPILSGKYLEIIDNINKNNLDNGRELVKDYFNQFSENKNILFKLHPHAHFIDGYFIYEHLDYIEWVVDYLKIDKVLGLLRKNVFDTSLSLTNALERAKTEPYTSVWNTKYNPIKKNPTLWSLSQVLNDSLIITKLSNERFDFPIFWYEELYTGYHEDLYPLLDYLEMDRNQDVEKFFSRFRPKYKLKNTQI